MSKQFIWPDVTSPDGARYAVQLGIGATVIIGAVTGLSAVLSLFRGIPVYETSAFDFLIITAIGFGIYKFPKVFTIMALIFLLIEKSFSIYSSGPDKLGIHFGSLTIFGLMYVNSIRGAFSSRYGKSEVSELN